MEKTLEFLQKWKYKLRKINKEIANSNLGDLKFGLRSARSISVGTFQLHSSPEPLKM